MKVLKFGGTSVANASIIRKVARIVTSAARQEKVGPAARSRQGQERQVGDGRFRRRLHFESLQFVMEHGESGRPRRSVRERSRQVGAVSAPAGPQAEMRGSAAR